MPIEIIAGAVAAKEVATVTEIAKEIAAQVTSQAEKIQASEIVSQSERIREISDFKVGEDPSNSDLSSLRSEEMSAGEEIATQLESSIPTEELAVEANLGEQAMEMVSAEQSLGDFAVQNFEISANSLPEDSTAQVSPPNISDTKTPLENNKFTDHSSPSEQRIESDVGHSDTSPNTDMNTSSQVEDNAGDTESHHPSKVEQIENTNDAVKSEGVKGYEYSEGDKVKYDLHTRNECLEGDQHPITGVSFERKTVVDAKGNEVSGVFPKFESKFDLTLQEDKLQATDSEQFSECNKQLKDAIKEDSKLSENFTPDQLEQIENGDTPDGYTWHHNEELGKMQLADSDIHAGTGHTGGKSIWGGGTEFR